MTAVNNSVLLAKSALRQKLKSSLSSMCFEERAKQSHLITEMVIQSPEFKSSSRVCLYLSMEEEVSTNELLEHIFSSGRQCFVPRYTKTTMEMLQLYSMEDYHNLPLTKWNIKQPEPFAEHVTRDEALASGGLDLIILPGLGFSYDKSTNKWQRLGRGKGYYDVYLARCLETEPPPVSIALAYREQIVDKIPVTQHDKPIEKVFYVKSE